MYSKVLFKQSLLALALFSSTAFAALEPLTDQELSKVDGKAGLTIDAALKTNKFDMDTDFLLTGVPYANFTQIKTKNFEIDVDFNGLTIDFEGNYATSGGQQKAALVLGLPDEINFNKFSGLVEYNATGGSGSVGNITVYKDIILRVGVEQDVWSGQKNTAFSVETDTSAPNIFLRYDLTKTAGQGNFVSQNVYSHNLSVADSGNQNVPALEVLNLNNNLFSFKTDFNGKDNDANQGPDVDSRDNRDRAGYAEIRFRPTGGAPITFNFEGDVGRTCASDQLNNCGNRAGFFGARRFDGRKDAPDVYVAVFDALTFQCSNTTPNTPADVGGADGVGCNGFKQLYRSTGDLETAGANPSDAQYDSARQVQATFTPESITLTPSDLGFQISKFELTGGVSLGGSVAVFGK